MHKCIKKCAMLSLIEHFNMNAHRKLFIHSLDIFFYLGVMFVIFAYCLYLLKE